MNQLFRVQYEASARNYNRPGFPFCNPENEKLGHKVRNLGRWVKRQGCLCGDGFCGFSGGADSTALLLALRMAGVNATAVHFHHGLRGRDADADAEWCESFCFERGIPFALRYLDVPGNRRPRESEEQCGRRLRMECWRELTERRGDIPVYLAHHADDAMENLFLRIARGSGRDGLWGMEGRRVVEGVLLVRPFLSLRKAELEDWLRSQGVEWRVDATNGMNTCRRNAVRNRLLPLWREIFGSDEGLFHTVEHLRNPVRPRAQEREGRPVVSVPPETLWDWRSEPILQWGEWGRLEAAFLHDSRAGSPCPHSRPGSPFPRSSQSSPCGELFSGLPCPVVVRGWRAGDRMVPFGWIHSRKLQDLFTDGKIPREVRRGWPVVLGDGRILLVPGVRRAEFGRCSEGNPAKVCISFCRGADGP